MHNVNSLDTSDLDAMAAWEAELSKRRSLGESDEMFREFFPELPPFLLEITSSEVQFVIARRALPYANLDFVKLSEALATQYELTFVPPDLGVPQSLQPVSTNPTADQLGQFLLHDEDPELRYTRGLYRVGMGRAFVISEVRLLAEGIFVKVVGPTSVSEQIAVEITTMLWALAGVRRPWEEIYRQQSLLRYGTATRVQLPDAALPLLSPSFVSTLKALCDPNGLARVMGDRPPRTLDHEDLTAGGYVGFSLDELWMLFHRTGPSGRSNTTRLRISVSQRSDQGSGVVTIGSELPFTEHFELVEAILAGCETELKRGL